MQVTVGNEFINIRLSFVFHSSLIRLSDVSLIENTREPKIAA